MGCLLYYGFLDLVSRRYNLQIKANGQDRIPLRERYSLRRKGRFQMVADAEFNYGSEGGFYLLDATDPFENTIPAESFEPILKDTDWMRTVMFAKLDNFLEMSVKLLRNNGRANMLTQERARMMEARDIYNAKVRHRVKKISALYGLNSHQVSTFIRMSRQRMKEQEFWATNASKSHFAGNDYQFTNGSGFSKKI